MNQLNENLRDDAAAYVLGAMSELEREAFRVKMMRECELGRYVESLERVGDVMLTSSTPLAVPDSIGASIMAEAQRDLDAREILESPRGAPAAQRKSFGARAFRQTLSDTKKLALGKPDILLDALLRVEQSAQAPPGALTLVGCADGAPGGHEDDSR